MRLYERYNKKRLFEIKDIIICCVLILSVIMCLAIYLSVQKSGSYAEVIINGNVEFRYPLNQDTVAQIGDNIYLEIKDNAVRITENDCPNKTCIKVGYISKTGQRIVCAHHKIVVVIRGENPLEVTHA